MPGITSKSRLYTSVVDRLAPVVQPDIEKQQGPQQTLVLATHAIGRDVPALLDVMEVAIHRTSEYFKPLPFPGTTAQKDIVAFLTDTLEDAAIQRTGSVSQRQYGAGSRLCHRRRGRTRSRRR